MICAQGVKGQCYCGPVLTVRLQADVNIVSRSQGNAKRSQPLEFHVLKELIQLPAKFHRARQCYVVAMFQGTRSSYLCLFIN